MAKVRQDAWSHEDDLLLAETVLRHIREGSTQLNAFEEVGDALNRTSAACGFRWNAEVRNKYLHAIELAKRQRKEKKRAQANQLKRVQSKISSPPPLPETSPLVIDPEEEPTSTINLDRVIHYLQSLQKEYVDAHHASRKIENLENENNQLRHEVGNLERELNLTKKKLETVEEDYKTFIQIMERARKMTVLEDHEVAKSPAFKMDKNGNLEQLAHGSSN